MVELLFFIFASIGLTNIIVEGAVIQPFKDWIGRKSLIASAKLKWILDKFLYMLNCYQCAGFWSGLIVGWALGFPILLAGFAGSFLGMFGYYLFALAAKVWSK